MYMMFQMHKQPISEGMVLTCEPGIYIPEENLGIRLENDVLITKNGTQDLMDDIQLLKLKKLKKQ